MTNDPPIYTTDLIQGTGLINETIILATVYEPGMSERKLLERVMAEDLLSSATQARAGHIVRYFFRRYVRPDPAVPSYLAQLRHNGASIDDLSQIMFVYTARANPILADFVIQDYFDQVSKGHEGMDILATRTFVERIVAEGKTAKTWSHTTMRSLGQHLTATLIDFRLMNLAKTFLPFFVRDLTANYLLHELHFRGVADNDLADGPDWALFGLGRYEVLRIMERLAQQGHFIYQSSGELVRIAWHYQSMNDFIKSATRLS